jgi:hypothetical protein
MQATNPGASGPRELQKRKASQAGGWDISLVSKEGMTGVITWIVEVGLCLSLLIFKGIFRSKQATHTNPQSYNAFNIFC